MSSTAQHHHVILTSRPDKAVETRELLVQCAARVAERGDDGPVSWCATTGDEPHVFHVEALFASQDAVEYHSANISDIVANFGAIMAAPPVTTIRKVFATG